MNEREMNMRVLCREKVIEKDLQGRSCHASHVLPMQDGSVLCVWFEGTREGERDVCIYGARRGLDGRWQEKVRLTEDDGLPHWNPVLFQMNDGDVRLFYKCGMTIADWRTLVQDSRDGGCTFGPSRELVQGHTGGRGPVRNKILRLKNGMLCAPASDEGCQWQAFMDLSRDGNRWQMSNWLTLFPGHERDERYRGKGVIQPTLWESESGVHALLRSSEHFIYRTDSTDGGFTWCAPYPTNVPNNNSGIDLGQLPDGRLLLCYNPVSDNWGARNPISLAVSEDDGAHFQWLCDLDKGEGAHEFSYPCVIAKGNRVHISYTFDRKNIAYWQIEL